MRTLARLFPLAVIVVAVPARGATVEQIIADRGLWPTEVAVPVATRATVMKNGQPAGLMLLGAGKTVVVTEISAEGVTGRVGANTVRVPVDKTDLLQRTGGAAPAVAPAPSAPPTGSAAPAAVRSAAVASRMQRHLAGRLVRLDGGSLKPVDPAALAGVKYYALYFSASWCGPCRQFTPQFVRAYRQLKEQYPEFEAVFVSADRSSREMRDYMREDQMPWLALDYDKRDQVAEILRYSGPGIPCLVLVAADGRVLSDSYDGDNYIGPGRVLRETESILRRGR